MNKFFVLISFFLVATIAFADTRDKVVSQSNSVRLSRIQDVINSYRTLEDLLWGFKNAGVLTKTEYDTISKSIVAKGGKLKDQLYPVRASKDGIYSREIGWKSVNGKYHLTNGKVVIISSSDTPLSIYLKVFEAFQPPKSSMYSLFWNEAVADTLADVMDSAAAAIGAAVDHVGRFIVGDIYASAIGASSYAFGGVVEVVMWPIRKFIYDGRVECDGSRYLVTEGFDSNKDLRLKSSVRPTCNKPNPMPKEAHNLYLISHFDAICSFTYAGMEFGEAAFTLRAKKTYVSDSFLESHFKGIIQNCNKENAELIEKALKSKASNIAAKQPEHVPKKAETVR